MGARVVEIFGYEIMIPQTVFDRWTWRGWCDPADPLTAEIVVEGTPHTHMIAITIRGGVPSMDVAIDAAQIALDAYADAIAATAQAHGGAAA